eukprot:SAG11_NODE_163_length_13928_cov_29.869188_5_plen_252_part_00
MFKYPLQRVGKFPAASAQPAEMAGSIDAATKQVDTTSAKPIWQMARLLCPSFKQLMGGEFEAVGMLLINLVRVVEIRFQTYITMVMERALNSRSLPGFKEGLLKGTALGFAATALGMVYGLLNARLTWKWRNKMTKVLHDKYFDGMNYYLIGAGGAKNQSDKLDDPDVRITNELNSCIGGFARFYSDFTNLAFSGAFTLYELFRLYGWQMALPPFIYLSVRWVHGLGALRLLADPPLSTLAARSSWRNGTL